MLIKSAFEIDLHIRTFRLDSISKQLPNQMLFKLLSVHYSDHKAKHTNNKQN